MELEQFKTDGNVYVETLSTFGIRPMKWLVEKLDEYNNSSLDDCERQDKIDNIRIMLDDYLEGLDRAIYAVNTEVMTMQKELKAVSDK